MNDFDVLGRIKELCRARSWTYYRLAKESGIPYSTLNTMLHKAHVPTVPSLIKICDGFGITLGQFFSAENEFAKLTKPQSNCLEHWEKLDEHSQELALAFMDGLTAKQSSK
ncbi:MAG: helix-turn-helix domain-containing protein [Oscillospiraceae bacterium]